MFHPLFWVSVALGFGISAAQFLTPLFSSFLTLLFFTLLFSFLALFLTKWERAFWIFFSLSVFFFGAGLYWEKVRSIEKNFSARALLAVGVVDSFPVKRDSSSGTRVRFNFKISDRIVEEKWERANQRVVVSAPNLSPIQYGDQLILRGTIIRGSAPPNPGGFDDDSYLERENLSARVIVKEKMDGMILSRGHGNKLLYKISSLKDFLIKEIDEKIPFSQRGIVKAILLGDQGEIPLEVKDDFVKSGTAHLLAISGGNVALLAFLLISLFQFFSVSKRPSYLATMALLAGYSILTGNSASILRATLMTDLFLLGLILKRDSSLVLSLAWSAIFILVCQPLQLFDPGFQLSYLSVFALGTLTEKKNIQNEEIEKRRWFTPFLSYFRNAFNVSLAAWLAVIPLVACYFFLFSPVTLLANCVIVPYFSIVLGNGFAFLLLGSIHPYLSELLGASLSFFTQILVYICKAFASIPFAYLRVRPPTIFELLIFYSLFFLYLFRKQLNLSAVKFSTISLIFINWFVWKGIFVRPSANLKITFLDVGHGDSALIEFPERGTLLVDAGPGGAWDEGRLSVAPFLWSKGITMLDGILITHPHFDHYGGLRFLLQEFSVGKIFDNGDLRSSDYEEIFKPPAIPRVRLERGEEITVSNKILIKILSPPKSFAADRSIGFNDRSLAFQLFYGSFTLLMAGDAEQKALRQINFYGAGLKSQVLKVSHHGSDEKNEQKEFFDYVHPETAVISESERNHFHLPSQETVRRLEQLGTRVFQTGFTGAVECATDGRSYMLHTALSMR